MVNSPAIKVINLYKSFGQTAVRRQFWSAWRDLQLLGERSEQNDDHFDAIVFASSG
jgi:hypothetical protein